jgi:hypothetical protein
MVMDTPESFLESLSEEDALAVLRLSALLYDASDNDARSAILMGLPENLQKNIAKFILI